MTTQIDKLKSKSKPKPLYIKKIKYVAYKHIIQRSNPYKVVITIRDDISISFSNDNLNSNTTKEIDVVRPVSHEIHLSLSNMTDSMGAMGDYMTPIAALLDIGGSKQFLFEKHSGNIGVFYVEENNQKTFYIILHLKDVIENVPKLKNLLFNRIDGQSKVYYLRKVTPQEQSILETLLTTNN